MIASGYHGWVWHTSQIDSATSRSASRQCAGSSSDPRAPGSPMTSSTIMLTRASLSGT